jgi:NCS1 family nucleobase:cation symporter-1
MNANVAANPVGRPTRSGDLVVESQGIEPIPEGARYGSVFRNFTVWFAPNLVPPAFFVGTLASAPFLKLGFGSALIAIIVGNIVGSSIVGLLATMGPKTGMPQMAFSRRPFGKATIVPSGLNWAMMIAWDAFDCIFGAAAFKLLVGVPFWVGLLLIIIGQAIVGFFGYEAIHLLQKVMSPALAIVFLIITVKIFSVGSVHAKDGFTGGDRIGAIILMTTFVASFVLAWAPYASEYSRYLPRTSSGRAIFGWTVVGLCLSAGWLEILGLSVASIVTGNSVGTIRDKVLGGGVLGGIAMIAFFLGTISVNVMNDYTGSLSLQAAGVRIWRPISAVVVAVCAFFLALWINSGNLANSFSNYLLLISYWVAAWAGVVVADAWFVNRGDWNVSRLLDLRKLPLGINGLAAFLIGGLASVPFMDTTLYVGPISKNELHYGDIGYYVGFIVAAAAYWLLSHIRSEAPSEATPELSLQQQA